MGDDNSDKKNNEDLAVYQAVVYGNEQLKLQNEEKQKKKLKENEQSKPNQSDNDKKEEKKDEEIEQINKFPVSVFVRIRPLVGDEITENHESVEYEIKKKKNKKNKNNSTQTIVLKKSGGKNNERDRKYAGFKHVILPNMDNLTTFNKSILPSINNIFLGMATCTFAYGHTGSGKTHTIFGYGDNESNLGMYRLFAREICSRIKNVCSDGTFIEIRFTELYQNVIRDLLSKEKTQCFIREDDKGNVHIRGQTVKYEKDGRVLVKAITSVHVTEEKEIIKYISEGIESRNVGKSTLHDKSSRSHAFLEFEIVNKHLVDARLELPQKESYLDVYKRKYDIVKKGVGGNKANAPKMKAKIDKFKKRIKELKSLIKKLENDENEKYIGGQFVFVDLAGNEYGRDVDKAFAKKKNKENKQNDDDDDLNEEEKKLKEKEVKMIQQQQEKERNEINKSLFALKECIRGLHNKKKRVPYRSSKLTMYLRKYLNGDGSKAIMITNIGPSNNFMKQTINTLQYCELVAKA